MSQSRLIGTHELLDLLLSFVVLTVAFSMVNGGTRSLTPENILVVAVAVGTGFMLHELAHKFVAQRYGYWAEYKASMFGLILTVVMALALGFVFAAPGAVMIRKGYQSAPRSTYTYGDMDGNPDDSYWDSLERKTGNEELWISLAGPITNIILASFFFTLLIGGLVSGTLLVRMAYYAFFINLMLAAFNLIPIDPLDGGKIFRGNALVWAVVGVPTILAALAFIMGYIRF
jgi:Zn-dependent protease